ncbi:phage head closure protein [Acinetobacter cumulans]|uniref:phage head closure protein n=1 Tax=Acinetobacter cumulans TaxID=2136182 RepID=UPI000D11B8F1|nr:phage head closure protein [Acinetobacter cumulans]QCO21741.1 phage head closure protein [Acinetobacter cumulans]
MNIGAMNKLCIVEHFSGGGRDEDGYPLPEQWTEFTRLYGDFQPLSSRDLIAAQAVQVKTTARLVTHFIDGINSTMRVVIHGLSSSPVTFSLDGNPQQDLKSNREYLTFNLVEM